MAPDEPSGARPAPVVLRIKLRYDDVEAMVQRFAPNVGKSGLFLPTKSLQAVGAEVKFELRLADDTPVLVGLGRVKAAKAADPASPKAAFGMAIELMRVTRESRDVIMKMLERRKAMGLPEVGIPMPSDIDAARRSEVDTGVREVTNTAVPRAVSMIDSAPVLTTQVSSAESGPVMTAPRRVTGPLAIAKSHTVTPLEPEAPRKKRAAVHEVIERASGPVSMAVTVPGLDDDVDVGAVLVRARALAGGDLDAELEALRELSAAPIEINIEAASAELARQLGGAPVRRDRSARWAPPPSSISTPVEAPVEAVVDAPTEPPLDLPTERPAPMIDDDVDPAAFAARESTPIFDIDPDPEDEDDDDAAPAEPVEPEQIADEIHQLQEADFEEVEHTAIGASDPTAFENHAFVTEPGAAAEVERSLEQHLADAEAEADADDLRFADEPAAAPEPEPEPEEEVDDFEILAEADAADDDLLAAHGEADASGGHELLAAPEPEPEPEPEDEFANEYAHIPARVRARQRSSSQRAIVMPPVAQPAPYDEPPVRPSELDFASRLELSDEFESVPEAETVVPSLDQALGDLDPRSVSAGHALAAFEDHERGASQFDEPEEPDFDSEGAYTLAGDISLDAIDLDVPSLDPPSRRFPRPAPDPGRDKSPSSFPPLRAFDSSDVIEPRKQTEVPTYRHPKPSVSPPPAADNYDLETALEALDVDLDDLSMPHAPTQLATKKRAAREPVVPHRAATDIPIDFDDFDED